MVNQNIKTNYTPKHKSYSKQTPANQQHARDVRAEARARQTPHPSASERIGKFLKRGASNFTENLRAPVFSEPSGRKPKSYGRVGRRDMLEAEHMFIGNVRGGNFPQYGGIDLSLHPDPMVSGMYRKPTEEVHKRKGKGGDVTEIHYHYH